MSAHCDEQFVDCCFDVMISYTEKSSWSLQLSRPVCVSSGGNFSHRKAHII